MASSGNTWQKKLISKGKQFALKKALGNEMPVMGYCSKAKPLTARSLEREDIIDKPLPKKPPTMAEVLAGAKVQRSELPMVAGWAPKPYGKMNKRRLASA